MQSTPQRVHGEADGSGSTSTSTPTRDHSTLLREQEAERERLRMDNFNQALRINFLEERLLRMKQGTDFASEDLESELAQLRMALEEREHELRQRNISMIRATEAIDLLNAQLQDAVDAANRAREEAQGEAEAELQSYLEERGGIDAETAEKWREEMERRDQQNQEKIQELEHELQLQMEAVQTLTDQVQELEQVRRREQQEDELRRHREQQNWQQRELAGVKAVAEAEHWKSVSQQQREQVTALQLQVETVRQENQTLDARYQENLHRMEEQVQHQMQQLQCESENYRAEHTRLLTDCEKTHFDKERLAMENKSIEQERLRLQAQVERMARERQQLAGETERLRLQHVRLTAALEEQTKSMESFKAERKVGLDTIHQLESKLHERRKLAKEHELMVKTLESRLQRAEAEEARLAKESESMTQELARLQTDGEQVARERQELANENLKLVSACEELAKAADELKVDSEAATSTIHQLESELDELMRDYEAKVKTLERRLEHAESEVAKSRCQQTSNERLLALEKDRQSMDEDNRRLRARLSDFQTDLKAMERKLQHSEKRVSNEAASAQAQRRHLSECQLALDRQAAKSQEYKKRLASCEDELVRRATRVRDLERQLAEAVSADMSTSTATQELQREWETQFATEKSMLVRQLDNERRRADEADKAAAAVKNENMLAQRDLEEVKMELNSLLVSCSPVSQNDQHQTVGSLVREAIAALKNDFKAEAIALETRWKRQVSSMNFKLEHLTTQLCASQGKLQDLERLSVHANDAKQSVDKTWSTRYEELRLETDEERRSFEEDIHYLQTEAAKVEDTLEALRARSDVQAMRQSTGEEPQHDYHAMKESNRLLFKEVQERRRATRHARKQHTQLVREKEDLLEAIALYKDTIARRDHDIEKYRSVVTKLTQQLQRRTELGEVKQTLLGQLEQTQYMITETRKRWEDSPIARAPVVNVYGREERYGAAISRLDEYIGRMHLVSERWSNFVEQSQELHRRYGDAWKSASRRVDRVKNQPRWVEDVERECSRLLTEAGRVSETMRDVANNIVGLLRKERNDLKHIDAESAVPVDNKASSVKQREDMSSVCSDFFDEDCGTLQSRSVSQPRFGSPVKPDRCDAPRRYSKALTLSRRVANNNVPYEGSLSSVGRKVQDLKTVIRQGS
uniref:Centrosomin N-terminal motif 1 domain-containing protein n=1 Tax=Hyaloperonospora arabidopsidis (strain Emoy2) TaxID=559515 RepID=M4B5R4_HYAAE